MIWLLAMAAALAVGSEDESALAVAPSPVVFFTGHDKMFAWHRSGPESGKLLVKDGLFWTRVGNYPTIGDAQFAATAWALAQPVF